MSLFRDKDGKWEGGEWMVECSNGCCIMNVVANCSCSGGGQRLANAGSFATNLLSSIVHGYQTGMFIWQKNLRQGLESFFSSQLINMPMHSELHKKLHIPDWWMPFNHTWEKPSSTKYEYQSGILCLSAVYSIWAMVNDRNAIHIMNQSWEVVKQKRA